MHEDAVQPTQVMPAATAGATLPGATQMGVTAPCPVCSTTNSALETYCSECGFLLASIPGEPAGAEAPAEGTGPDLVETRGGRRFRLRPGPNTVGRESADILLMDATVSRRHATVTLEGEAVAVTDLGSTNGTRVDGVRLAANEPTDVQLGAVVSFGNAALALVAAGEDASAAVPAALVSAPADRTLVVGASEASLGAPAEAAGIAQRALPEEGATKRLVPASGVGPVIPLSPGILTVGRRSTNDVVIDTDPYVSGSHARLETNATGSTVTDVGSTNGSVLNGQKLVTGMAYALCVGDELQLGQSAYRCEGVDPTPAAGPGADADIAALEAMMEPWPPVPDDDDPDDAGDPDTDRAKGDAP